MSNLIIADKISDHLHGLPDHWLGARVAEWMFSETVGKWWIAAYQSGGKLVTAAHRVGYVPSMMKQEFALRVLRYVNKHCNFGGAWLAGYLDKDCDEEFYLLWKDNDGDIRVPIEFPQPFHRLLSWRLDDFCNHAAESYALRVECDYNMDYSDSQLVKLAQGERLSGG